MRYRIWKKRTKVKTKNQEKGSRHYKYLGNFVEALPKGIRKNVSKRLGNAKAKGTFKKRRLVHQISLPKLNGLGTNALLEVQL